MNSESQPTERLDNSKAPAAGIPAVGAALHCCTEVQESTLAERRDNGRAQMLSGGAICSGG